MWTKLPRDLGVSWRMAEEMRWSLDAEGVTTLLRSLSAAGALVNAKKKK